MFEYQLKILFKSRKINPAEVVGQPLSFELYEQDDLKQYFNGYVKQFQIEDIDVRGYLLCQVTVVPWFWFLTQTLDYQIFQNQTVPQIVQAICENYGFGTNLKLQLSASNYQPRECCIQYEESAFEFISRLLLEEGIFYYFIADKDNHSLVLADGNNQFLPAEPRALIFTEAASDKPHFSLWHLTSQYQPGKVILNDYLFTLPENNLLTTAVSAPDATHAQAYEVYRYSGEYQTSAVGKKKAENKIEGFENAKNKITAQSDYRHLTAGNKFSVSKTPVESEQQDYIITAITHHAKESMPFGKDVDESYNNDIICIPDQENIKYRNKVVIEKRPIQGVHEAIVVGPSDKEIYTDEYGRVKVQFMWDRLGKKDANSSCWVRVAQHWTGAGWGMQFVPRIGQEVLVIFVDGDPTKPVIISCFYNGLNHLPYPPNEEANLYKSGFKTHSEKSEELSSNEFYFDDKQNNEQIYLHAQKDLVCDVKHDDTQTIGNNQTITVTNDRTESVKKGNESVTIEQGNRTVTISQGNDSHEIKQGNRSVSIDTGNDILAIKQGNRTVSLNTGNDQLVLTQGNHSIEISLGKSSITALQGIELTVGDNSIKIDQTGVSISGLMIKLSGQSIVEVEAEAMLTLKGGISMIN